MLPTTLCPIRPGSGGDALGTIVPRFVASPRSAEEVADLVATARDERLRILCVGGGTALALDEDRSPSDVTLSTKALDATIETRPEDMTITVGAGTTVSALSNTLARFGQRMGWDPALGERATVGGVLASNSTGGLAHAFGHPSDLVLGMTIVDGRGRTLRVGGRVVKNVAGYDVARLFTGSCGTLGTIVQATLRTHPLPESARTVCFRFADSRAADAARAALFASPLPLAALDLELQRSPAEAWALWLRVEGSPRSVEAQLQRIAQLCGTTPASDTSEWWSPFHGDPGANLMLKVESLPARVVSLAAALHERVEPSLHIAARLGSGSLRVSGRVSDRAEACSLVRRIGAVLSEEGSFVVSECLPSRAAVSLVPAAPAITRLERGIKDEFDPGGIFPALSSEPGTAT